MKIAVFGGTFNPVHRAHLKIANEFVSLLDLDKVLIIPTFIPPHKNSSDLADGVHRLNMCKLIFTGEKFQVSDIEIKRQGKSYSYDTLCALKRMYPDDELYFIIGSDMLLSFDKWYRYADILSMCTLCVMTRESEISSERLLEYAKNVLSLGEEEIVISNSKAYEMSSTMIREKIKRNENLSNFLTKEVENYIKENKLYE